jgi:predicted lactoylglutathione lyase
MTKQIWLNLPVKDIGRSTAFFKELGFTQTPHGNSEASVGFMFGENNFVIMMFLEQVFKSFVQTEVADTSINTTMLISIDAQSREEVDAIAQAVTKAGGNVFAPPGDNQGYMYGCGFSDPDGHRWNVVYMDVEKMPKQ